ncbi:ABC transporter permease [Actinomadura sp. DC4]|uniref:ABC transporter permease n=1 Tax=Actinomadura sp. DC4 TaxID=3055069 RepID=UPI0025AF3716|nr:ABC transporter permease [Actinomadura sp. DC4]MDN3360115.1 ABC transporter permease [Actinomadura sp. DC4]
MLVFLLIGEVIGRIGLVDRSYLPPASSVLARAGGLLTDGGFLQDVAWTLKVWAVGLLIAVVIAVPVGLLLGSLPVVNSAVRVLIEFLRPIPAVALIPLVILMIADQAQIEQTLAAYAAMWPILINTVYAVGDVDPVPREMARSFGLGRAVILARVALPSVAPFVATGIRVASSIALIVTISTELTAGGGEHGIGIFILNASSDATHADVVFAAAGIAGLLGYLIDVTMRTIERRLFRWHYERLGRAS